MHSVPQQLTFPMMEDEKKNGNVYHNPLCSQGVVAITTAQLHSGGFELNFPASLNPARDVPENRGVEISINGSSWK